MLIVVRMHRAPAPAVYQVTRQGHEHCDVTDGMLLDIAPLDEGLAKLITLYDKDLAEGVNLLIGEFSAKKYLVFFLRYLRAWHSIHEM